MLVTLEVFRLAKPSIDFKLVNPQNKPAEFWFAITPESNLILVN